MSVLMDFKILVEMLFLSRKSFGAQDGTEFSVEMNLYPAFSPLENIAQWVWIWKLKRDLMPGELDVKIAP